MMELISAVKMFGGSQKQYSHRSALNNCDMTFSVFLPPQAETEKVPVLYWLSGLTCTDQNFVQKAGAQRYAAEHGIAIVCPDTSPRGEDVSDDPEGAWDFGLGAGFYVNATQQPWQQHYQMYSYVNEELPALIEAEFPVSDRKAISGHSMGGHGALVIALRNTESYRSVSAFAPIVNPMACAWGQKAFSNYLGDDKTQWRNYDACSLLAQREARLTLPIMVNQGSADNFLAEQLLSENLVKVCSDKGVDLSYSLDEGYDHSYFFIASFIEQHIAFHAKQLKV